MSELPKVGDLVRVRKKGSTFQGYEGRILEVIPRRDGLVTFTVLIRDFTKDGSAIAPKLAPADVESVG